MKVEQEGLVEEMKKEIKSSQNEMKNEMKPILEDKKCMTQFAKVSKSYGLDL